MFRDYKGVKALGDKNDPMPDAGLIDLTLY